MKRNLSILLLALAAGSGSIGFAQTNPYTQRFIDLRAKIINPANGYFSKDGVPYHTPETLICEAPDYGHETTSEAYSYWIWLEAMNGRVTGDWTSLNAAWAKMEAKAIPTPDLQPTTSAYDPSAPATYAAEFPLPDNYPAPLIPVGQVPVGKDPVSPDLTATYGSNIYGMHWIFDCDNFYGFGNKGDGVSTPSYMNTFQRGEQESVWETIPQPCWESFKWGSGAAGGYLTLFTKETSAPTQQWKYTNAPDADARAVQAIYWAVQFAKEQGLNPASTLPVAKASKMGDFGRLALFDKYFKTIGSQSVSGGAGTGYSSAHYLLSWYYAWGGPLTPQGWAWRIGSSHAHFGYQNPVSALALSTSPELKAISANGPRDWAQSLTRQLEFYQWLQSAEGAIAGGATNSFNGRYDPYPVGTPTFYGMAYQENPVYHDPGSNTWFGFQAWSMERVAEYYYITGDAKIKPVLDKWIAWVKTVVHLLPNGTFELPSEIGWSGAPNTWNAAAPVPNTNLHVIVVSSGQDLGIAAATAKALTYYAAATQKFGTLDTASRDLAKAVLDRMWTNYFEPAGKGVATPEDRKDFTRFFSQTVFVPPFFSGKMPNGDAIVPGIKFLDIRSKYRSDPDFPALQAAITAGTTFTKTYHRFWAQADIALANAEFGRFFGGPVVPVAVTGVSVTPALATVGVGATTALTATIAPATASNKTVTWASNNTAVATVNAAGIVTGVAGGSATITATTQDGGFTASSSVTVSISNVATTGVTVSPTSATVAVGVTTALTATVAPANASNKTVSWTSSNTAVATVNASGVVTGVASGSAMITVTTQSGSFTASAAITVPSINIPATGVTVTPATASVAVGATTALTATVAPANASNKSVTWSSSSPAIATVNASGVVTGVAAGSATITATTASGAFTGSATITVTGGGGTGGSPCTSPTTATLPLAQNGVGDLCFVTSGNISFINSWNTQLVEINGVAFTNAWSNNLPARINGNYYIHYVSNVAWAHLEVNGSNGGGSVAVTGVSVTPATVSVANGGTASLVATVAPATASNKSVTWTSSNTSVATVNASGLVTGVTVGSATVTAKTQDGGFTASAVVTVTNTNIPVTGVSVSPTSLTVAAGSTSPLTALVSPANATTKSVTWSSSAPAIATVSASGVVTGVSAGSATITATAQGGFTASTAVTVTGGGTGGTACTSPSAITLSFAQNGAGDFCFVTSGTVSFLNSWNMQLIEINGVNYTNKWANSLPPRINGNYYVHYVANVPWAHLEINGN